MVCNRHIPTLRNDLLDTTLSAVREEWQRDPGTSPLAAHYEYNPYGNVIGPDDDGPSDPGYGDCRDDAGPYALDNPFRFSTKWFDNETGLGYWGKRYYRPRLGRWLSRDPIEEKGGLNVYAFAGNIPTQAIDPLGELGSWEPFTPPPRGWDPTPPNPSRSKEVCGIYVWLYTGQFCIERYKYNAALDAAVGTEQCWFDCMVEVNKCAPGLLAPGALSLLVFTHEEIQKTAWELSQGMMGQSEVTTLQSRLSYTLLGIPGFNWVANLLRQNAALVSSAPLKTAGGSVVAGAALIEAGVGVYCGYTCSGR